VLAFHSISPFSSSWTIITYCNRVSFLGNASWHGYVSDFHFAASWQHALGIRLLNTFHIPSFMHMVGVIEDVISHYVFKVRLDHMGGCLSELPPHLLLLLD